MLKINALYSMNLKDMDFKEKFANIKLLALDFDGVMTDGYVYVDEDGKESVRCSRRDGLGVEMLKRAGIDIVVISKEENSVVSMRCKKLNIACWQNVYDGEGKLEILKRIAAEKGISLFEAAYMGDDLNDREVLGGVGFAITVADGHEKIKKICHFVTVAKGGEHAVREVCEKILQSRGIDLYS